MDKIIQMVRWDMSDGKIFDKKDSATEPETGL